MQVRCDEGVAIHIGRKPCVCAREGAERSVGRGAHRLQPLSRKESQIIPKRRRFNPDGRRRGGTRQRECSDSPAPGRRPWHQCGSSSVGNGRSLPIRGACVAGSRREGEEP